MIDMNIGRRLTMLAQWKRPSNSTPTVDIYGDSTSINTVTDVSTISCYAYQDFQASKDYPFAEAVAGSWIVVLSKDRTDVIVGQLLEQITDKDGNLILSAGRIVDRTILTHHSHGTKVVYCLVKPNG